MEQEEFIQKIQQHGSTLEVVITKIMDIITAFDIYEDYYYWPLIRTQGDMEINNKYDSEHMDNRNFITKRHGY